MNLIRFPKFYIYFLCTIFILSHVTISIEGEIYSDSISLLNMSNNHYDYLAHISRRHRRQNTNAGQNCEFPKDAPNSAYAIINKPKAIYNPGDYVEEFSILGITCDPGYKLPPFTQNTSFCVNGQWGNLPNCLRACRSLSSTKSITVKCYYNNDRLQLRNCINPVEGTTAHMSCNTFYEADSAIRKNPYRACRNGEWIPNLPECYATCGLKSPKAKFTIFNGANASQGDYPWQVGIYTNKMEFQCGGSIIDQNIILSAAHCFTNDSGNIHPASNYLIAAGKHYRQYYHDKDEFVQYSTVRQIFVPEEYKSYAGLNSYDIAVVILENAFTLTVGVLPVCIELNDEYENRNYLMNKNGIVTGWGSTQEGDVLSDVLKELIIPFIPRNMCFEKVPPNFQRYLTEDKICGGYLNQSSSVCAGDSGGGLVYNVNKVYHIEGIVSTSPASMVSDVLQCDPQQYSLYTSIHYHIKFIRKYVTNYGWKQSIQCARDDCINEEIENNGRCRLPDYPQHGKYSLANTNGKYTPGDYVYIHEVILLSCDAGYEIQPAGLTELYCQGKGNWKPVEGTCKLTLQTRNGTESSNVILETTTTHPVHQGLDIVDRTKQGNELCPIPSAKINRVCKLSSLCSSALTAYLIHKIAPIRCGFANDEPLVCCDDDSIANIVSKTATTKLPSSPSTRTQKENFQVGDKSKQKCKEYEKFVYYGMVDQPKLTECTAIKIEDTPSEIPAKGKEFPHIVLIGYDDKENTTHWNCGGSLISENFVLSAAHCTFNNQYQKAKYILLGELVLDSTEDDAMPQKILIKNAIRHPEFRPRALYNDVALFELENNALLNAYTRPACLNTNPNLTNILGVISGWGESIPPNTMNKEMRKVSLDIFTNPECNHSYRRNMNLEHGILEEIHLCAGSRNETKDICQEGSGGPLQIVNNQEESCTYMIIGVRSFRKSCNKKRAPVVYTKVSSYIKWIEDIVWPEKA